MQRAHRYLSEALDAAEDGGYRLIEIEARIGLFDVYRASQQFEAAKREYDLASKLVEHSGYEYGRRLLKERSRP